MIIPLILIVIGLVFFAEALGFIQGQTIDILWPLLLIVVGFAMMTNRMFGNCCEDGRCKLCRISPDASSRKKNGAKKKKRK